MLDRVMTASLQDMQEADEIRVDVAVRIFERVAHARLGGQIDDPLGLVLGEKTFNRGAIRQIAFHKLEILMGLQARKAGLLQIDVVIVIEVVEADDVVAARKQRLSGVRSDEARSAGNQYLHSVRILSRQAGR